MAETVHEFGVFLKKIDVTILKRSKNTNRKFYLKTNFPLRKVSNKSDGTTSVC